MNINAAPRQKTGTRSGTLIVEAVVASFLMLFAFMAATQLFDASLRWESGSINNRLAALVAERHLEELRGWVDEQCQTTPFGSLAWASQEITNAPDNVMPDFVVTVRTDLPVCTQPDPATGRGAIPVGLHSPASQLFAEAPPGANGQKHPNWLTYAYTRSLDQSLRRVQITVNYGNGSERQFRLLSLLGDPVAPAAPTAAGTFPDTPVRISGPSSIPVGSPQQNFQVVVRLPSGQSLNDVTAVWTVDASSTGSASIRPVDAQASEVVVTRSPNAPAGSRLRLAAKVRYRGQELIGYSSEISL
jgi:hypothetical protein